MLASLVIPPLLAALDGPAGAAARPAEPQPIVNGNVAATCQWPASIQLDGCSGTLVHPRVVLFAAHCGTDNSIQFGERSSSPEISASVEYCRDNPDYGVAGTDYAYCLLRQPVMDVPIAPVLFGCETRLLEKGTPVVVVGFGQTDGGGGGYGTKRWLNAEIAGFPDDGRMIGISYADADTGACFGDSGGSAYVQLEDGSWRAFGITSTIAGACGLTSQHVPMASAVAWVEQDSGIDITPCHDADGSWNPTDACTGFPEAIHDGSGRSWANACAGGPVGGVVGTCGPEVGEPQDTMPPALAITTPSDGDAFPGPEHDTPIELDVSDMGDGWGVRDVRISFAGEEQVVLDEDPWRVGSVVFPAGTWEITATARDWSGNTVDAEPITITVGEDGGDGSGGTDTGNTGDTGGSDPQDPDGTGPGSDPSDTSGPDGTAPATDGDGGCSCRATRTTPPTALAPLLVAPLVTRRRRARGASTG